MSTIRGVTIAGLLVGACTASGVGEPQPAAAADEPVPAWARVVVEEQADARTIARHELEGHVDMPATSAAEPLRIVTPVIVASTGVYAGGERVMRLHDGRLPPDVTPQGDGIRELKDALAPQFAGKGWAARRIGLFADRHLRFSTLWPVFRTVEEAAEVAGLQIVVRHPEDPPGAALHSLQPMTEGTLWDGSVRGGRGSMGEWEELSQTQIVVALGATHFEVGRLMNDGTVRPMATFSRAEGVTELARLAERLWKERDPNAYGTFAALLWADDDLTLGQIVDAMTSLTGPKCTPAERATATSPNCWFVDIALKGRRSTLHGLKLERW